MKPSPAGLRVEPCLPGELDQYTVRRRYRDALYVIHVRRTGKRSMTVDGEPAEGTLIPIRPGKTEYHVEVTV